MTGVLDEAMRKAIPEDGGNKQYRPLTPIHKQKGDPIYIVTTSKVVNF